MNKDSKLIHVRVSESMYNLLNDMSKDKGCSVCYLVRVAVRRLLTLGGYFRNER